MKRRYVCPDWPVPVMSGTAGEISGCGIEFSVADEIRESDPDRWVDCPGCGLGFNPDHLENRR